MERTACCVSARCVFVSPVLRSRPRGGGTSHVRIVVESNIGIGGGAGGLPRWVSVGAEISFGEGTAIFRRSWRGFHAGGCIGGDGTGGNAIESPVGRAA